MDAQIAFLLQQANEGTSIKEIEFSIINID